MHGRTSPPALSAQAFYMRQRCAKYWSTRREKSRARPRWFSTARTYGMSSGRSRAALLVRHGDVVSRHKITSCDGASSSRLCSQLRGAGASAGSKSGTSRASGPYVVLCTIGHATVYPAEISHNFTARLPRESRMTLRPPHVRRVISRAENHVMSCMIHTKSRSRGFMGPFRDLTQ